MQAVRTAIGNLGVNTSHFDFSFQPILATEFFLSQPTLILRQFSRVFGGVAGIAGFKTFRGDKQILDTHLFIGNGQQGRLKFTQARHEIAPCLIFRNGNRGRVRRKRSTPVDVQGFITLRQLQFTVLECKSAVSKLRRLTVFLGFEDGVVCSTFKKILNRSLLVPQALLQGNAGHSIQKSELR